MKAECDSSLPKLFLAWTLLQVSWLTYSYVAASAASDDSSFCFIVDSDLDIICDVIFPSNKWISLNLCLRICLFSRFKMVRVYCRMNLHVCNYFVRHELRIKRTLSLYWQSVWLKETNNRMLSHFFLNSLNMF